MEGPIVTVRCGGGWLWIQAGDQVEFPGVGDGQTVLVLIMRQTGLSNRKVNLCRGPVTGMGEIALGTADLRSQRKPWV